MTDYGRWTYGEAGDRYPAKRGDVFRIGPHALICGDLELGDGLLVLERFSRPDFVYVDPPWNKGNLRAFRTKAALGLGLSWADFLRKLLETVRQVKRYAFIEMGRQEIDFLQSLVTESGGHVLHIWPITYYRKNPTCLLAATWDEELAGQSAIALPDLTGMDDDKTPVAALRDVGFTTAVVLDPCLGLGLTGLAAEDLDMRLIGMELHPRRLARAVDALAKRGYEVRVTSPLPIQHPLV